MSTFSNHIDRSYPWWSVFVSYIAIVVKSIYLLLLSSSSSSLSFHHLSKHYRFLWELGLHIRCPKFKPRHSFLEWEFWIDFFVCHLQEGINTPLILFLESIIWKAMPYLKATLLFYFVHMYHTVSLENRTHDFLAKFQHLLATYACLLQSSFHCVEWHVLSSKCIQPSSRWS